ncbi:MAG: outer membrane beta-barrel protein [Saprospiraceae bacterium]|nr:outer membrane beta-barrel protein [Saprospiraceae bacterium]
MKNIQFTIAICLISMATLQAQSGKFNISAGVGFEPTTKMDGATINSMPVMLKVGYQISPLFSINAVGGHVSTSSKPTIANDGIEVNKTTEQTFLGLRGELKKGLGERFEVYGGAAVGYINKKVTEKTATGALFIKNPEAPTKTNHNAPQGEMMYSGFVGTNFYPTKHVGLFAEIGYGVSLFNAGVTLKF